MTYRNLTSYQWSFAIYPEHRSKPQSVHQYIANNTNIAIQYQMYRYNARISMQLSNPILQDQPIFEMQIPISISTSKYTQSIDPFLAQFIILLAFFLYLSFLSFFHILSLLSVPLRCKILQRGRNAKNRNPNFVLIVSQLVILKLLFTCISIRLSYQESQIFPNILILHHRFTLLTQYQK